jgi:hypothetical protein
MPPLVINENFVVWLKNRLCFMSARYTPNFRSSLFDHNQDIQLIRIWDAQGPLQVQLVLHQAQII